MKIKEVKKILFLIPLLLTGCNSTDNSENKHNLLEHQFINETIITDATCLVDGTKTLTCECGAVIEEKIPAKGHDYDYQVKQQGTCIAKEILEGTCSCGAKIEVIGSTTGHQYEWTVKEAATCESKEVLEGKCSVCDDVITKENDALGHAYGEYYLVSEATTIKEGLVKVSCANGCLEDKVLKVLKTPVISRNGEVISWIKIDNATGYKLYNNDTLVEDLGNVLSCNIPLLTDGDYSYSIVAYTDNEEYLESSNKSNEIEVSISYGNNLQEGLSDFEYYKNDSVTLNSYSHESWTSFSDAGSVKILKDSSNKFAKLHPVKNLGSATLTNAGNINVTKAGTYTVSIDVKLGSAVDGSLSLVGLYVDPWVPETQNLKFDLTKANTSSWTTLTCEYTLAQDVKNKSNKDPEWVNIDIGYTAKTYGVNNYVLVDNFKISEKGKTANLNSGANNTFESIVFASETLSSYNWKGMVYVMPDSLQNSLEIVEDNNTVVKMYASKYKSPVITVRGNPSIGAAGIYKLTLKVKAGPDANRLGSVGFRMYYADGLLVSDVRFEEVDTVNSQGWVTLEATFKVLSSKNTSYVNIEVFGFTNNDVNSSVDNYLLIDDLAVYKVDIQ